MATIRGLITADTIIGTALSDRIYGQGGDDSIQAGAGNDYAIGGIGNDIVNGGLGNDLVDGSAGMDTVDGGGGNDVVDAGIDTVRDWVYGNEGDDSIYIRPNDIAFGGAGYDSLNIDDYNSMATRSTLYTLKLSNIGSASWQNVGNGIYAAQFEHSNVYLGVARAGSYIIGSPGDDYFHGGYNTFDVSMFGVNIDGADGDDTLSGSNKNDTMTGGEGSDVILGNAGNDLLTGNAGADIFNLTYFERSSTATDIITDFAADDFILIGSIGSAYSSGDPGLQNIDQNNPLRIATSGTALPVSNTVMGQFLYTQSNGKLYYDADGVGAGIAYEVFKLQNNFALTAADFIINV